MEIKGEDLAGVAPPPVQPDGYTAQDAERDPEAEKLREQRRAAKVGDSTKAEERLLDIPYEGEIAGKKYAYSARPIGYMHLIFKELARLGPALTSITSAFREMEEGRAGEDVVQAALDEHGATGVDTLVRIAQLLVQPINPSLTRPPTDGEWVLDAESARWGLTTTTLARLLMQFYLRDLFVAGSTVKNLIGLGRRS